MIALESPQTFIVSQECQKVAWQNGFRRALGEDSGWSRYGSTTAQGVIHLAAFGPQGPWALALDHAGVVEELNLSRVDIPGPGCARYVFDDLRALYAAMPRVYQLAASLPDAPLQAFLAKVSMLPETTEAERLVIQRIGQDIFRASLVDYWRGSCPLTGITDPALLRASHIVPWSVCASDAERLDVHNGLLLSALWDAAFDRGLVTFDDNGNPLFSPHLSLAAREELRWQSPVALTDVHLVRMAWHRAERFWGAP